MKKPTLENLKAALIEQGWTINESPSTEFPTASKEGRDSICLGELMRRGLTHIGAFLVDDAELGSADQKWFMEWATAAKVFEEAFVPKTQIGEYIKSIVSSMSDPATDTPPDEAQDTQPKTAPDFLQAGIEAMKDRAASRDNEGERSMAKTVKAFNALTGGKLTEREGWLFMVCLKLARANNGKKTVEDDFIDGAAYMALYGECAVNRFEECEATFVKPKAFPDELAELEVKLKTERSEFAPNVESPTSPPKGYPREGSRVRFENVAGEFWGTVYYPPGGECRVRPDNKPELSFSFKQLNVLEVVPPPGD